MMVCSCALIAATSLMAKALGPLGSVALGIEGTPGYIVDAKVNVGFLPLDGLQQAVGEARKQGCQVC